MFVKWQTLEKYLKLTIFVIATCCSFHVTAPILENQTTWKPALRDTIVKCRHLLPNPRLVNPDDPDHQRTGVQVRKHRFWKSHIYTHARARGMSDLFSAASPHPALECWKMTKKWLKFPHFKLSAREESWVYKASKDFNNALHAPSNET